MKYKLGLDLGSTSLGWAVVELNDMDNITRLVDMGVRIFPDGRDAQSHTPINVVRREHRQMRRRGDRVALRKKRTLQLIHKYGMDFDIHSNVSLENPYALRARAVVEKLQPQELGRVLFHLALRRGFKSNRKETRGEAGGKLKNATVSLQVAMGDKTLGQFQFESHRYRFADQFDGNKIKDGAFYPTRDMYLDEFNRICAVQELPDNVRKEFEHAIFHQRPLLPPVIGTCMFELGQLRAYKFEPVFQRFRVLQQINQLRIIDNGVVTELSGEQRQKLQDILLRTFDGVKRDKSGRVKITFAAVRKMLGLARGVRFNLETEKRKEMDVDTTAFAFSECGLSDFWYACPDDKKSQILARINDDTLNDDDLIDYLVDKCGLNSDVAAQLIQRPFEEGIANLSVCAMQKMLPFLAQGDLYHVAADKAGYNHADRGVVQMAQLPYYGDVAALKPSLVPDKNGVYRTMNATVHIALNQLRAVVNDLIAQFGSVPYAINIEMGRDVRAGARERAEIDSQQAANKRENDRIASELVVMGVRVNRENIQKYKLWENLGKNPLDRRCVYTGEIISKEKLFSPEFEIEHILPFSRTLDDSMANKTISAVAANRFKGNRSPDEAFTDSKSPWHYDDVVARAQNLPGATKWRFNRGAMSAFLHDQDCIARALNDTRFMTRMAVTYLQHVCADKYRVTGMPGRMTAMLRDAWHLDWWKDKADEEKYRGNHIHHAIDAFVVACTGVGTLQHLSRNAIETDKLFGKTQKEKRRQWFVDMNVPFDGFDYYDFKMRCENTIISYRQSQKSPKDSKGTIGCLHEDTAYNLEFFERGTTAVMSRRDALPTTDKDKKDFAKAFNNVNPKTLQMFLKDTGTTNDEPNIANKFLDWCTLRDIRKVRMYKRGVDVTTYVPVFRTKRQRDTYRAAYLNWYVASGIAGGIADKKMRLAQQEKEKALLQEFQNAAKLAYKWYVGGNNFCADVFKMRDDDKRYPKLRGRWQVEILSNYNAQLDAGSPLWRRKYATAERVMRLRINDMVMATFSKDDPKLPKGLVKTVMHQCTIENTDTVNVIFRVKKISSNGTIYLRPHFIAKEEGDTKSWAASAASLQEHNAHKVYVSPSGKLQCSE